MARYRGPKCKICRSNNEKLFLKGKRCETEKCSFNKRPYPPGRSESDVLRAKKVSDYRIQLMEKQKVKHIYGILERQFKNYFKKTRVLKGHWGENLLILLERRLDNIVYRGGFAPSRACARQMILHNHVKVKGKKMNIPSYLVKISDVIEIEKKIEGGISFPCSWLKVDGNKIEVLRFPERKEIEGNIDEEKIVAFYSK